MCDAACPFDAPTLQRAVGELRVDLRARDGRTVLEGLRQAGCLKARFPRPEHADWSSVVTLNTSGGIAGGDRLDSAFTLRTGARATIAAQAAERFYRALPSGAASQVRTHIAVADGAAVEWLPQETILFDRCARSAPARRACRGCLVPWRGKSGVWTRRDGRVGGTGVAA
jgi:urease accessory protein